MNALDWMPRFVMEDGTVVMPEDVKAIDFPYSTITYDNEYDTGVDALFDRARADRPTGLRDKSTILIYENDWGILDGAKAVVQYDSVSGQWLVGSLEDQWDCLLWEAIARGFMVAGIVPYAKEGE